MRFISGKITQYLTVVTFSSAEESFIFCFMPDSSMEKDIGIISIPCENKLIFGQTFDHRQIAIYTGTDNLELFPEQGFHTSAYILSKSSCSPQEFRTFNTINFYGGTIKKIFKPHGLQLLHGKMFSEEKEAVPAKLCGDHKCFTVDLKDDGVADIEIGSTVKFSSGDNGNYIDNSEVILTIKLSKPQPIHNFFRHYQVVINLLRFMTYRQNVVFDRITLGHSGSDKEYLYEDTEVFIEKDTSLTDKEFFRCIGVEDLGDSFAELVRIAYEIPGKDNGGKDLYDALPPSGYIPENDFFSSVMSTSRIREICSAIEYELHYANDLNIPENQLILALCKEVKSTIREFRTNNQGISNDAYSAIYSNLSHWSLPLRERLIALCQKYETEIGIMAMSRYGEEMKIEASAIKEFVDFRNGITHNGGKMLNHSVTTTAFLLSGVVYCCILDRIGVPRDAIQKLCNKGMLR